MELIRAIIVDDELPSLRKLEKLLVGSGLAEVAGALPGLRKRWIF